jgi:transposase
VIRSALGWVARGTLDGPGAGGHAGGPYVGCTPSIRPPLREHCPSMPIAGPCFGSGGRVTQSSGCANREGSANVARLGAPLQRGGDQRPEVALQPRPASLLTTEQKAELRTLVIDGPDLQQHKVVRWRCVDLREEIARRFSVKVHESTVGKWLHELGLTRLQPRPSHPKKEVASQEAYKKLRRFAEGSAAGLLRQDISRDMVPR